MTDFSSVPAMFMHRVQASADRKAFTFPAGESGWQSITWKQTDERVRAIAGGLRSLELANEQRVAILSATSLNWILADLGILSAGGATTTIYPSNKSDECAFIIKDSATGFVFAENDDQVAKLVEAKPDIPGVKKVITFEGTAGHDGWVITLKELEELGRKYNEANPTAFEDKVNELKPDQLATLIYTSGTTGTPKGVELTHDCWVYEGEGIAGLNILTQDDDQYLWLPLSHSFGKVLEAAQLHIGFHTTVDGRIPKLVDNLKVARPTFMAAAPRIFEKVYNKVVTGAEKKGGLTFKIFSWSLGIGRAVSGLKQQGREPTGLLAIKYKIAHKLVFSKLQATFGGRIRFFISGSAPLSRDMAEFFHAAGILILEGYGLTESSAGSFVNRPNAYKFGTVGQPMPGTQVKIAPEDGEILLGGRGIMRGYHNLPDVTKETLTDDHWLRTGDIGEVDSEGYLKITDRKKDLIKTSGGKYVAPQSLESKLKALCPYLSQVLVHGDRRNFCSALVTLDPDSIPGWAADNGLGGMGVDKLSAQPKVIELVQKAVDKMNSGLPSYETIKKFAILPTDWSIETGELTASLKVKRKVVEKKFGDVLDGFYGDALKAV